MIQFELDMMIASEIKHEELQRYRVNDNDDVIYNRPEGTKINISEGIYQMFKVDTHKLLAPIKLFIKYRKNTVSTEQKVIDK